MEKKLNYMAIPGMPRTTNRDRSKLFRVFDPEIIIKSGCEYFNMPMVLLKTKCRKREYVTPRHIMIYFLAEYTDMTYLAIGKLFNRHHTMAIYSKSHIMDLITTDDKIKAYVDELKKLIASNH